MTTFLNTIAETNEYMKANQKKEYIKLFGEAAQIFEDALLPFLHKIMNSLLKKLKDPDVSLHPPVSDSIGLLVQHSLKNIESKEDKASSLSEILKLVYG